MKLNLNQIDLEKLNTLIETKEINMALADMLFSYFSLPKYKSVKDIDEYLDQMVYFWQLDMNNDDNQIIVEQCIRKSLKQLNPNIITNNEYFKTIKVPNIKEGNYELAKEEYKPYQAFSYDDIDVDENYIEIQKVGYFTQKISYPVLRHKGTVWMSITPNEILTMQDSIKEAKGKVLVLGLGLGYYQFMISNKPDVKEVIVIEKDKNIISLFKKHLLPQFPNKNKIKIIESDAFDYLENTKEKFDYCFLDLWHDPEDGLPLFLRLRKYESKFQNTIFNYWLNKSILAMYRRLYLIVIQENLMGYCDKNYQKSKDIYDQIINNIYFKTKEKSVNNFEEINAILTDEYLQNN
jgi:hypothetical protein